MRPWLLLGCINGTHLSKAFTTWYQAKDLDIPAHRKQSVCNSTTKSPLQVTTY